MNRSRLGRCLHLVAPFLMMLTSFVISIHDPSIDPMEIVDSIHRGSRTVLLLAPTPLSQRVLVIVSSPGNTVLDNDAIVFDQPRDTLTDISMQLTYSAEYFRDKWPKLPRGVDSVGLVHDDGHEYLVVGYSQKLQMLNLDAVEEVLYKNMDSWNYTHFFGENSILLSSPDGMQVYSYFLEGFEPFILLQFPGNNLVSCAPKRDGFKYISTSFLIDFNAQGVITFTKEIDQNSPPDPTRFMWNITAGYITHSSVYLVDGNSSSIITFDVSVFARRKANIASARYRSIPFFNYWIHPQDPTPSPNKVSISPSKVSLPRSKVSLSPSKPTPASSKGNYTSLSTPHGNTALIIAIVVILSSLLLGALVFYLLRQRGNAGEPALVTTEKMPKGDGSRGKVVNRKSSKRSSKGRSSKGATASKGKNRKRSKRSGKLSPSKSLSTLAKVTSSKPSPLKRRKSSKRRASPRHRQASLKPLSSIKRRPFSRKTASPRRPSGKVASLHPQSSIKRHTSARKKRTPRPLTDYQKQTLAIAKLLI